VHDHLRLPTRPVADPANVLQGDHWRITVLTEGLVRLEHSPTGVVEDRPSQLVLHRDLPPVDMEVVDGPDQLMIRTSAFELRYDRAPFWPGGLSVQARGGVSNYHSTWRPGTTVENLGGTARTLDTIDGPLPLEDGLLSRHGVAVIDDSDTLLFGDDGQLHPREPGATDLYVFAHGRDYHAALDDFHAITGPQPLLPRAVLGNWWSRYFPYTADGYLALHDRFEDEGLPFSVAVIDMDWHLVDIPPRFGSGWTGYTWNRDLVPDPEAFLAALHDRGLAVTLNVHPADGIRGHEDAYPAVAQRLGIDPATEHPIGFEATDSEFLAAYLEEVHHPLEEQGVDFWWLDWQQGEASALAGVDPLWVLNHVHWLDSGRDGSRELTFSRYAGLGSHRYPLGFSGDTVISWDSLHFQPEFTATAANVGYGWWSHDIGGHFGGIRDDQLLTRWVQFGVFSPILRLHSGADPFNRREPWGLSPDAERVVGDFLRLRHRLVPYLATMMHRTRAEHRSLVAPMYHDHPWVDAAYDVPNQYTFGTDLVVAPVTTPVDPVAGVARTPAWLPPGDWVDLLTGVAYRGDRSIHLHRTLDTIPVLARAGTVLPLVPVGRLGNDVGVPDALDLVVVPGADGSFTLVEDDDADAVATTAWRWDQSERTLTVAAVDGHDGVVPAERDLSVVLLGFADVDGVQVTVDGDDRVAEVGAPDERGARRIALGSIATTATITLRVDGDATPTTSHLSERVFTLLDRAMVDRIEKNRVWALVEASATPGDAALQVQAADLPPLLVGALSEVLLAR